MLGDPPPGRPPCQGDPPPRETPTRETPCQGDPLPKRPPSRPTPKGEIEGDQVQAHTQGGNSGGIRSRPTPKGEIEGDQIKAHTQGGNSGGSDPGRHPRGKFRGIRSRPTSKGVIQGDQDQPPLPRMTTAAGGMHPTGMHSCFCFNFTSISTTKIKPCLKLYLTRHTFCPQQFCNTLALKNEKY